MKAISISPGNTRVDLVDLPEPEIAEPDQIKMRILEVGICGTDRDQVRGGHAAAPEGSPFLVIGHEMLGEVVAVGSSVTSVRAGDLGVFSVRRGCGKCVPCRNNRSDMCYTGNYTERGIKNSHGFDAGFVVDHERYFVNVPRSIRAIGVLAEPMSVVEKAIDEAFSIQRARLPELPGDWIRGRQVLVAGVGAIGLLAVIALLIRGARVVGMDIVDESTGRAFVLKQLGGLYVDLRKTKVEHLDDRFGQFDFVFEATGVADLGFNLIDALGVNGIYVMTGIPHDERPISFSGAEMMTQIVLKNQIILGSVNAAPRHFQMAIDDLMEARNRWGALIDRLITSRVHYSSFEDAIDRRSVDDIKTVVEWT